MPLPDAEPAEDSRLYEELKSKSALVGATGGMTADLLDSLRNATFLDYANEDQLRRIILLMNATGAGSMSGPIAGTSQVVNFSKTGTAANGVHEIVSVGIGEAWVVEGISIQTTNVVSVRYKVQVKDVATSAIIEIADETVSASKAIVDPAFLPITIDTGVILQVEISNATGSSVSDLDTLLHRVR